MLDLYILDHHDAVLEPDHGKWANWMIESDRVVARTANGVVFVSTVFLGIDHNYFGGRPLLFETMSFLCD